MQASTFQLVLGAGWFVKLVLVVLLAFSIGSWAVVLYKLWVLHLADQQSRAFLNAFQSGGEVNDLLARARASLESPLARVFQAVHAGQGRARRESLDSLLTRLVTQETNAMYSYLGFLATTGSTTPFIGLLGTVWGIMDAFRGIGAVGSASLAVVAPAIAEALIATAAGLMAAIPAVMAYNYFLSRIKITAAELEQFADSLRNDASRRAA